MAASTTAGDVRVDVASPAQMVAVRRLRHDAYAAELGQHAVRPDHELPDALDGLSTYLVVEAGDGELEGFVSVTPPAAGRFSVDKDVDRAALPFPVDDATHEVRLLTVRRESRRGLLAPLLMLAALRWVESRGGSRVVVKGRSDLVGMYERVGLVRSGVLVRSGAVEYEVMSATTAALRERADAAHRVVARLGRVRWDPALVPSDDGGEPVGCFHGGASWDAVGADFDDVSRRHGVVPADVLDAWFPPAPGVLAALVEDPAWLARTSPPTDCSGMLRAVGAARGLDPVHLLPGAGSSALVFLALGRWLSSSSRVLLLDPTYGEYAHVLERVVGARVDRLGLRREEGWAFDPQRLVSAVEGARRQGRPFDLVVLVNPNSPTGRHVPRADLEAALAQLPASTRVWVDETYVDHVALGDPGGSLERFAAASRNAVVVKSLSKAFALSGMRVAYLVGPADVVAQLRTWTPPWAVALPAQVAAVRALADPAHYRACWAQTAALRDELSAALSGLGLDVVPGVANFLLAHLPEDAPTAAVVVARCRESGVFLRDAGAGGSVLGPRALRVAVRSAPEQQRIVDALAGALAG